MPPIWEGLERQKLLCHKTYIYIYIYNKFVYTNNIIILFVFLIITLSASEIAYIDRALNNSSYNENTQKNKREKRVYKHFAFKY